jgi:hypothetical protein
MGRVLDVQEMSTPNREVLKPNYAVREPIHAGSAEAVEVISQLTLVS